MGELGARLLAILDEALGLEVTLVDNGSQDGSRALIHELSQKHPRIKAVFLSQNSGYGNGIKQGLKSVDAGCVGWTHADLQTDPRDFLVAMGLFGPSGKDFVKGIRKGRPWLDSVFSRGMEIWAGAIFGRRLRDINGQPTLVGPEMKAILEDGPDDFSFDLYALVMAKKLGLRELRFPTMFGERYSGRSSWNTSALARLGLVKRTVGYSLRLRREVATRDNH